MALYEFECKGGHRFEKLCLSRDTNTYPCPQCGRVAKRLISAPASIIVTEMSHTDTNIPMRTHNLLKDRNRDKFEHVLSVNQGKKILPEDM